VKAEKVGKFRNEIGAIQGLDDPSSMKHSSQSSAPENKPFSQDMHFMNSFKQEFNFVKFYSMLSALHFFLK
jgi:hypothetical protein